MAAYTGTATYTAKGVNNSAPVIVQHVLAQVLANADTVAITLPAAYADYVVASAIIWSPAAPRVNQVLFGVTSQNITTGVVIITATGAVATGSTVCLTLVPAT